MGDSITFYGLGIVAKDKQVNSLYVDITPTEVLPSTDGVIGEKKEVTTQSYDSNGGATSTVVDKTGAITARWINDNTSNVISAPQVCAGETVRLYKLAGGTEFGWKTFGTDMDLRKKDRYVIFASSKSSSDKSNWGNKGYYLALDGIDKKVQIHTSTGDGEPIGYDLVFDTKEGKFILVDTTGNVIELNSVSGNLSYDIKNRVDLKLKKFTVKNGTCELLSTLVELCDALETEQHIDSMRGTTVLTPGSKSKYSSIKSKFKSFI